MKIFRFMFLAFALLAAMASVTLAQAVGDFGTGVTPGTWTTASHWVVCTSPGTWAGATVAATAPATTTNIWVRNGHTMSIPSSGTINCKDVNIENGGILNSTTTPTTSNRYLKVYGNIINNGTFGGLTDGLSLNFNANCTMSGTPTLFVCNRFQPNVNSITITFNCDVSCFYPGSGGTGGAGLYANAKTGIAYIISAGKTLTMGNLANLNIGTSSLSDGAVGMDLTVNGTLTFQTGGNGGKLAMKPGTGNTANITVNDGGTINLGQDFLQDGLGTTNITVNSGGAINNLASGRSITLTGAGTSVVVNGTGTFATGANTLSMGTRNISGTGVFTLSSGGKIVISNDSGLEPVAGPIRTTTRNFSSGATYSYVGTAAQVTGSDLPSSIGGIVVGDSLGVTLTNNLTVTDTTSIVNAGTKLQTGNHVLTNNGRFIVAGTFQIDDGGWATGTNNFVYNSTGTLAFNTLTNFGVNNDPPRYWPDSIPNVTVNAGGITLNVSRTVTGVFQTASGVFNSFGNNLYAPGIVQLNGGGYFSNFSPTYVDNGTLVYNTGGTYGVFNEWIDGSTVGYGVPKNVTIQNATLVTLPGGRSIAGALTLTSGDLDLNGNTLTLAPTATLVETSGNTVVGTSGVITTTRTLNAPAGADIAGLGISLTSAADLGSTVITRGHAVQTGGGNNSIKRYYDVAPTNNTGLNATLAFHYDDSEFNGIPENRFQMFKSTDGGTSWSGIACTVFMTTNIITVDGQNDLSRWTVGDFTAQLPIQLASFTASALDRGGVRLDWTTVSEVNNYGFYVQRKNRNESVWNRVSVNLIPGNGTTNSPHHYSFIDNTSLSRTTQYRLEQVDLDGAVHFTEPIEITGVTSVAEIAPMEFALKQNHPNPFNPSTEIQFSVQTTDHATLTVYNMVGQSVAVLFDGLAEAGQYYQVRLDATHFASGTYFYRLTTNNKTAVKKMLLMK